MGARGAAAGPPSGRGPRSAPVGGVLAVVLVAALSFSIAQTAVIAGVPEIARELDASTSAAAWAVTGYLLAASVATPLAGKLGDLYGKGRVLGWVLVVFAVGCALSALAQSIEVLVAGRLLQGVAGGAFPLGFGIANDELPPERRAWGIGLVAAMFGAGAAAGFPLAGLLTEAGGLPWVFWALLLLALPGAVAAWTVVPPSPVPARGGVDLVGAAVLATGLGAVLLGVSQAGTWGLGSPATLACLAAGLALLLVFVPLERRTAHPLVDVGLLGRRPVLATNVSALLAGLSMFSGFVLVPQLAQAPGETGYGLGLSLLEAGLLMVPGAAGMLLAGPFSGVLGERVGFRAVLAAGMALAAAAFAVLAVAHGSLLLVLAGVSLLGLGIACAFTAVSVLVIAAVPQGDIGIATGITTIMRTVGGSLGAAVATAILAADRIPGSARPAESAYVAAFAVSGAVALAGLAAAAWVPGERTTTAAAPA